MSPHLVLQFLGLPQISLNDQPVVTDRRKAIALLAYLSVNDIGHPSQRYTRDSLSALLWPDYEQAKAFSNLRRTIWEVHEALGENWLIADRESVRLNPAAEIDLDVSHFQSLLSQAREQTEFSLCIPLLNDAVKLYRNHFLTGFSLKDAHPFNEWAFAESEELRHKLADALTLLSDDYCGLGQADKAIPHARRLTTLEPLNEAAHRKLMEVYLQAGQHGLALKQYQTCEQILRKELNLDPQPETRALYKKIRKREINTIPIENQTEPTTPKHNLPAQLSTFIGREKEQDEIINLLAKNRLVTLAGVGGIGKTRLSLQVGENLLKDYRHGVWFVPLDSLSDPALIPSTVAAVFDIREGSSDQPIIERLSYALRQKTTLLIFDNCEHLLDACAQLSKTLLINCPNLKILATSREVLNLEGEATYYLSSLSIADDNTALETLTDYESVQLFVERASLALSSFQLTKENAQTIAELCRKVDGIPLAIELAAAHVNILNVEEILRQLDNSFALLARDSRTALPRHQTLRASMDWSWGLLPEPEQSFMRQLSIFAGGWMLESAQAVCDGDVLNLTSALVKKSLILVSQEANSDTRYRFHEIVRQYAHEKLSEPSETADLRTRHLHYFLNLSEQAEPALRGPTQIEWMSRLKDERDNIRAALKWADKTDLEAGLYISGRLRYLWEQFDVQEGIRWLTEFTQKPKSNNYPLAKAKALLTYGRFLIWLLKYSEVRVIAQECLAIYRAQKDQHGEIDSLDLLARSLFLLTELEQSLEVALQALDLSRSLGDKYRESQSLMRVGECRWQLTTYHDFTYFEQAIQLNRELKNWSGLAGCMVFAGGWVLLNGNLQVAEKYAEESMSLFRQLDDKRGLSAALENYGRIALVQGDLEKAHTFLRESIEIRQEVGERTGYLWSRSALGYVALWQGDIAAARHIFSETIKEFFKDKIEIGVVFNLEGIAGLYIAIGKPEIAAHLIGWADATRERIKDTRPPLEQPDVDKIIAACVEKMSEAAFSDAYDEGQKMSLDEAVAYALREG